MLLGGRAGEGLEPVRVVGGALLERPVLHRRAATASARSGRAARRGRSCAWSWRKTSLGRRWRCSPGPKTFAPKIDGAGSGQVTGADASRWGSTGRRRRSSVGVSAWRGGPSLSGLRAAPDDTHGGARRALCDDGPNAGPDLSPCGQTTAPPARGALETGSPSAPLCVAGDDPIPGDRPRRARTAAPLARATCSACPALAGARVVPAGRRARRARCRPSCWPTPTRPSEPGALVVCPGAPPDDAARRLRRGGLPPRPRADLGVPVLVLPPGAPWGAVIAELVGGGRRRRRAAPRPPRARAALRGAAHRGPRATRASPRPPPSSSARRSRSSTSTSTCAASAGLSARTGGLPRGGGRPRARATARPRSSAPSSRRRCPGISRALVTAPAASIGVLVAWVAAAARPPPQAAVLGELAEACAARAGPRGGAHRDRVAPARRPHRGADGRRGRQPRVAGAPRPPPRRRPLAAAPSRSSASSRTRTPRAASSPTRAWCGASCSRPARRWTSTGRGALVDWNEGRLLALLPPAPGAARRCRREEIEAQAFTLGKRLLGATRETVPGLALTLALSRYTPEPERLGAALDEARLALSIGERLGPRGRGGHLRGDRHLQAALPDLRRPAARS